MTERNHTAFGAARDRAADVAQRAQTAAAGQDKPAERRQFGIHLVNLLLQRMDIFFSEAEDGSVLAGVLSGKIGTDVKEFVLDCPYQFGHVLQVVKFAVVCQQTDVGIEFIDGPIGLDTHVIFAHARTADKRGRSLVASQCIYFTFHYLVMIFGLDIQSFVVC